MNYRYKYNILDYIPFYKTQKCQFFINVLDYKNRKEYREHNFKKILENIISKPKVFNDQ